MPPRPPTPAPPSRPIVAGRQDVHGRLLGWRPRGTLDWLLVLTTAGRARVRTAGKVVPLAPGDLLLFPPRTPQDYGAEDEHGRWANTWLHFQPRTEWRPWLAWPPLGGGPMRLSLAGPPLAQVAAALAEADAVLHGTARLRREAAMNALERALIVADGANPRQASASVDPRIEVACALLAAPDGPPIAAVARRVGLSRSRFSVVFAAAMGCAPQAWREAKRLDRAAELLAHSFLAVADIAAQTGFADPFYLSRRFRARFGESPSAWRARRLAP